MRGNSFLKKIDYIIGIPIVFLLGLFTNKKKNLIKFDQIGILMTAAIGDTLIASAVINEFKNEHKKTITLFCTKDLVSFAKSLEFADHIIPISLSNPILSIFKIRQIKFDLFIDFGQWARINSIFSFFSHSKFKIGFKTPNQFRHFIYNKQIEHSSKTHEINNYRNLFSFSKKSFKLNPVLKNKNNIKKNFVLFHMCPSGEKSYLKHWPKENWIELANFFIDKNYEVYLSGGPDDFEFNESIKNQINNSMCTNLATKTSLDEILDYLKSSKLVISVNTGIMHMAAALNADLISLNGPTDINRWGALSKNSINLHSNLECAPCLNLGFEYGCNFNDCMKGINVESVKNASKKLLEKNN